jgi:endoglucanase
MSARIIIVVLVLASLFSCTSEKRNSKSTDKSESISASIEKSNFDSVEFEIKPDKSGMKVFAPGDLVKDMGIGWNIGNSLEAIGGETKWGNPIITKRLIDSVKSAGFKSVRIPVAWSKFSDPENYIIQENWMKRVEEVVNYVLNNDMYAVLNIHWDEGWMQPTYEKQEYVNDRLSKMWKQIATHFRDYDYHLLFAGTNEVMKEGDWGTPTEEYYTVQNSFNQTFVNTVRQTGGKNAYRILVIQGFNTNIDHAVNFATIPEDIVKERLMMEVHYYDPYNFALNEKSKISQWGKIAKDTSKTDKWGDESYADNQFLKMKTSFTDKNIPVIIGEYGAISRKDIEDFEIYREYYISYITGSIINHGHVPFYWDNGYTGNHAFGLFKRETGEKAYPGLIKAITGK